MELTIAVYRLTRNFPREEAFGAHVSAAAFCNLGSKQRRGRPRTHEPARVQTLPPDRARLELRTADAIGTLGRLGIRRDSTLERSTGDFNSSREDANRATG